MAKSVQVVIPTYRRPERLKVALRSLHATAPRAEALIVVHHTDRETLSAIPTMPIPHALWTVDYGDESSGVSATNLGMSQTSASHVVIAQDDVIFHPGWLDIALQFADGYVNVIGLNDLFPGRDTAQHSVCWVINGAYVREYGLAGEKSSEPGSIFHSGYRKNYADNELCDVAKARGVWAYAKGAVVEHLHPAVGKAGHDHTLDHLEKFAEQDRALYTERSKIWGDARWL
jgi:GT2 family glycosyltransferase